MSYTALRHDAPTFRALGRSAALAASVLVALTVTATAPAAELTPERAKEVVTATVLTPADVPGWNVLMTDEASAAETTAQAVAQVSWLGSGRGRRCMSKALRRALKGMDADGLRVTVRPLWVPGPVAGGVQIRMSTRVGRKRLTVVQDLREFAVGPVVASVVTVSFRGAAPEAGMRGLLATMRARAEAALATGAPADPPAGAPADPPAGPPTG